MATGEDAATTAEQEARPAYPPAHHFLRDLDTTTEQVTAERCVTTAPLDDLIRNDAGAVAIGFLAALVDINAATVALLAGSPDWTATADLSLHATGWLTEGPVVADSRLVRAGVNIVVVAVDVYDGHGLTDLDELPEPGPDGLLGPPLERTTTGLLTFARIPRHASASAGTFDPAALVGQRRHMTPDRPPTEPLLERFGLELVDAEGGVVELHNHDYVRNSFGTVNGGVLGAVFQAAAEAAVPGMVATDLQVHYLSQVRTGPVRTSARIARTAADHAVCTIRAVDAGNDDQVLSLATVTLQRPPL